MDDDLEAVLAADEAAIKDAGFSADVARSAQSRSKFRRGWLAAAGVVGLGVSLLSLASLSKPISTAVEAMEPGQFVLSLPIVDLSIQMQGQSLMAIAIGLAMLLAIAAARFVGDEF